MPKTVTRSGRPGEDQRFSIDSPPSLSGTTERAGGVEAAGIFGELGDLAVKELLRGRDVGGEAQRPGASAYPAGVRVHLGSQRPPPGYRGTPRRHPRDPVDFRQQDVTAGVPRPGGRCRQRRTARSGPSRSAPWPREAGRPRPASGAARSGGLLRTSRRRRRRRPPRSGSGRAGRPRDPIRGSAPGVR